MKMIKDIACGVLIMVITLGIMGWAGYMETTYDLQGTVLSHEGNIWYIEDSRGEVWEYESVALADGEEVKITFFDNHTHRIKVLKNHN